MIEIPSGRAQWDWGLNVYRAFIDGQPDITAPTMAEFRTLVELTDDEASYLEHERQVSEQPDGSPSEPQ